MFMGDLLFPVWTSSARGSWLRVLLYDGDGRHHRPATQEPEWDRVLKISDADQTQLANCRSLALPPMADMTIGSPMKGVTEAVMQTLISEGEQLVDTVIEAYLELITTTANGHFDIMQKIIALSGSPRWFVWPTSLVEILGFEDDLSRLWPPNYYPKARVDEVETHLFPLHIGAFEGSHDQGHWVLVTLVRNGESWTLFLTSGIPGYRMATEQKFLPVRRMLSQMGLDLQQVPIDELQAQPRQDNGNDCGMFVLAEARRMLSRWPDSVVEQEKIPALRKAFALELTSWKLRR